MNDRRDSNENSCAEFRELLTHSSAMSESDDELAKFGCECLARTARGQVAISSAIRKDYESIDDKKKARLTRIMELWCDGRPLTEEMFNGNEGRSPKYNLMLQAFKGFKVRLYGFVRQVSSIKTFIIVDIDLVKKQNKADQGVLKRAKDRVDNIGKGN